MKLVLVLATALLFSGCGKLQRMWTGLTGQITTKCFEGILYIQSDSGIAWHPTADGKPTTCSE